MYYHQTKSLLALLAVLNYVAAAPQRNGNNGNSNGNNNGGSGTTLLAANIQDASASDGGADEEAGQSPSLTDTANFINFCSGKTITNGAQVQGGSCNGITMGDIPSTANMIASIIVNPGPGDNIAANTDFNIQVQVTNLVAGTFTNPDNTYYAAPQQLQGGKVVGHTHVTVQDLGNSLAPNTPPAPGTFAFFKGINDDGNGNGLLAATVKGGLPAGNYRVCTMTSSSNHQPVLMPVAQRGAQDDCQKFTVGGNANANGNNGNNNAAAGTSSASTGNTGNTGGRNRGAGSNAGSSTSAAIESSTTTAAASGSKSRNGSGAGSGSIANGFTTTTQTTTAATTAATGRGRNSGAGSGNANAFATTTTTTAQNAVATATATASADIPDSGSTDGFGFGRGRDRGNRRKHRFYEREMVVV